MIEQVKAVIAEKMAPAIDARAPYAKVMFDAAARASVEALRDPPDEILLAIGEPYGGSVERQVGLGIRRQAWNKMLDAILAGAAA
jgi:hypothetical protein